MAPQQVLPVGITSDLFLGCEGITPTMLEILEATFIDELKKLTPASKEQVQEHLELQYKCKKGVVMPHFLMKILMDTDLEDPFILLRACCKALLDFNEASPVMVDNEEAAEDKDDRPILALITFFCVVQFLFFAALDKTKAYGNLDMLMTSRPHDWAVELAAKHGIATKNGSGGSPNGVDATRNLGATLECFTVVVNKSKELQEVKVEKDVKKLKIGQDKTHIRNSDAFKLGIGDFLATTGVAWQGLGLWWVTLNVLEYLAGGYVALWMEILVGNTPRDSCILSQMDSTCAVGWLHKSSFDDQDHLHLEVARAMASLILDHHSFLYSQWFKGKLNKVANSLT
jgi:hypothetical protein